MRRLVDRIARSFALLALVFVAACDEGKAPARPTTAPPAERAAPEGELAGVAIRSTPSPALIFFDGRFVGQTSSAGPIEIVDAAGRHQIRLSEAGRLDAVHEIDLAAGTMTGLTAALAEPGGPWDVPAEILLSVGQPVRCLLRGNEPIVYVVDEEYLPKRMLVVTSGSPKFKVIGHDGKDLPITKMPKRPAGTPGNVFYEYEGGAPGRYRIEVSGRNRAAWRFVQGLPPLAETDEPAMKGRRRPPVPPRAR